MLSFWRRSWIWGALGRVPVKIEGQSFVLSTYFQRSSLARSRAPWVRKSGYLCNQDILVLTKSSVRPSVRTYVRPPLHVRWNKILHFKHPACFGGKLHGHLGFQREKKNNNNNNNKAESFCRLKFNVHINVDNGESASARMKKKEKGRPISLEETSLFTDFLFSPTSPPSTRDNDKNSGKLNDRQRKGVWGKGENIHFSFSRFALALVEPIIKKNLKK